MLLSIFRDNNDNFQWISITAIAACFAVIVSLLSLYITISQGKKNRKANTLVSSKLELIKDLKEDVVSIKSLINIYLNNRKRTNKKQDNNILKKDPILSKLNVELSKMHSKIVLNGKANRDFSIKIGMLILKIELEQVKDTTQLAGMMIELQQAYEEYENRSSEEIEKNI